jgi:hypothetical protein
MSPCVTPQVIDRVFLDLVACGIFTETEPGSGLYKINLESEARMRFRSARSLEISERGMNMQRQTSGRWPQ